MGVEWIEPDSACGGMTVEIPTPERWSAEKNARFKELACMEALGDISVEGLAELESLTRIRRFARYPRSADEILWHRHQQNLARRLVQALKDYVEFHEAARGA